MTFYCTEFPIPAGRFSVAVDDAGAVAATAFGDCTALAQRLGRHPDASWVRDEARTHPAREQVRAYFAGSRQTFDLQLAAAGTPFQERVWQQLRAIPYGETRTYGELARRLGTSPRAVGNANGANPLCVLVPCHRVVGHDGALTGFAFGTEVKRLLLEHERGGAAR